MIAPLDHLAVQAFTLYADELAHRPPSGAQLDLLQHTDQGARLAHLRGTWLAVEREAVSRRPGPSRWDASYG